FRNVKQYFISFSLCKFYNSSEIQYLDYLYFIDLSNFRFKGNSLYSTNNFVDRFLFNSQDLNNTFFVLLFNNNGSTSLFLHLLNNFSTRPDDGPNEFSRDHYLHHFRSVSFYVCCRLINSLSNFLKNMQTTFSCLFQCIDHDLIRKSLDLYVHLAGGNPVRSSGDLEIHVS